MILEYILFITSMVLEYLSSSEVIIIYNTDAEKICSFHVQDSRVLIEGLGLIMTFINLSKIKAVIKASNS